MSEEALRTGGLPPLPRSPAHLVQGNICVYEQILLGRGAQLVSRGITLFVQGAAAPNKAGVRGEKRRG